MEACSSVRCELLTPGVARAPRQTDEWITRLLEPANFALAKASSFTIGWLALACIALIGVADYWSGYEHSMLIFYLMPVTLGTWFVSRNFGFLLSLLSITTSSITDVAAGLPQVRYWNEAVGLASYAVFVWTLSRWRALLKELDARVQLRTADLQREILERAQLEHEMIEVTQRERRRLGHDLHDSVCQHFAGTALAAQSLRDKLAAQNSFALEAGKVVALIEEGLNLTRDLARGLFSADVHGENLHAQLENLSHTIADRFGIHCEFHCERDVSISVSPNIATQLYRIAQEAAMNAGKHAQASRVIIELDSDGEELKLNIFDDGIGFDERAEGSGLGLRMMRHGAQLIGAHFSLGRSSGKGAAVSCSLPLLPSH